MKEAVKKEMMDLIEKVKPGMLSRVIIMNVGDIYDVKQLSHAFQTVLYSLQEPSCKSLRIELHCKEE